MDRHMGSQKCIDKKDEVGREKEAHRMRKEKGEVCFANGCRKGLIGGLGVKCTVSSTSSLPSLSSRLSLSKLITSRSLLCDSSVLRSHLLHQPPLRLLSLLLNRQPPQRRCLPLLDSIVSHTHSRSPPQRNPFSPRRSFSRSSSRSHQETGPYNVFELET